MIGARSDRYQRPLRSTLLFGPACELVQLQTLFFACIIFVCMGSLVWVSIKSVFVENLFGLCHSVGVA